LAPIDNLAPSTKLFGFFAVENVMCGSPVDRSRSDTSHSWKAVHLLRHIEVRHHDGTVEHRDGGSIAEENVQILVAEGQS
jgi:hypothetical protein